MKKIVISGFYGHGNLGDEAILSGWKSVLGDKYEILPLTFNKDYTYSLHGLKGYNRFSVLEIQKAFGKADYFISGGGGLFQDWSFKTPFYYGVLPLWARFRKIPSFSIGQSIGPLRHFWTNKWTEFVFKFFAWIGVRDYKSWLWLQERGINAEMVGDIAFQLWDNAKSVYYKSNSRHGIGVILRDWKYTTINYPEIIKTGIVNLGKKISFLFFRREEKEKFSFLPGDFFPDFKDALAWIGERELVIGMRLHAIIFALLSRTPFVAIAYDSKIKDFLEFYHLEDCMLELSELNTPLLEEKLSYILENKERIFNDNLYLRIREQVQSDKKKIRSLLESKNVKSASV
jgi:polysaccharide pyruvyl transferase CsaB